jgi:hypothetical protein
MRAGSGGKDVDADFTLLIGRAAMPGVASE